MIYILFYFAGFIQFSIYPSTIGDTNRRLETLSRHLEMLITVGPTLLYPNAYFYDL